MNDYMKKILLKIAYTLCFILAAFSISTAWHFLLRDFGTFLAIAILATGPTLGTIALFNEIKERRSKKILISLCVWAVVVVLLTIISLY